MVKYEDYRDRYHLMETLIDVITELKQRNRFCIEPDDSEKRALIFLSKFAKRYLESIKSAYVDK